jgi:hypothetical protein
MVTAQCLKKTAGKCDHNMEVLWLKDSRGRKLPVSTHCEYCYNKIWSDGPIDLLKENRAAIAAGVKTDGATEDGTIADGAIRFTFDFFQADLSEPARIGKFFFDWSNW